jgi:hypothetical protein
MHKATRRETCKKILWYLAPGFEVGIFLWHFLKDMGNAF